MIADDISMCSNSHTGTSQATTKCFIREHEGIGEKNKLVWNL